MKYTAKFPKFIVQVTAYTFVFWYINSLSKFATANLQGDNTPRVAILYTLRVKINNDELLGRFTIDNKRKKASLMLHVIHSVQKFSKNVSNLTKNVHVPIKLTSKTPWTWYSRKRRTRAAGDCFSHLLNALVSSLHALQRRMARVRLFYLFNDYFTFICREIDLKNFNV